MPLSLPPLPYPADALEPVISAATVELHYQKHHRGYLERLGALVAGTALAGEPLEAIVRRTARGRTTASRVATFNAAAQAWNHAFYWESLRPRTAMGPGRELSLRLARDFAGQGGFASAFKSAALGIFGSGWAWLVLERGTLKVATTADADTPIAHGRQPLLCLDVWEHAYYLDYHERRAAYVGGVVDHLLNWDFAARNLRRWEARPAGHPALEGAVHA